MISVGHVEAMFNVKTQGIEVCFDPMTEQQMLSFKFALHVSLPQLIQRLLEVQQREGTWPSGSSMDRSGGLGHPAGMPTGVVGLPPAVGAAGVVGAGMSAPSAAQVSMPTAPPLSAPAPPLPTSIPAPGQSLGQGQIQMPLGLSAGMDVLQLMQQSLQNKPQLQAFELNAVQQQMAQSVQVQAAQPPPPQQPPQQPAPPAGSLQQVQPGQLQAPSQPPVQQPQGPPVQPSQSSQAQQVRAAPALSNASQSAVQQMQQLHGVQQVQVQRVTGTSVQFGGAMMLPAAPSHPAPPPPPPTELQNQNQLVPWGPAPSDASSSRQQLSMALIGALRSEDLQGAKELLRQRADANFVDIGPSRMTPLHHVIESGGNLRAVDLLLKARANVNAQTASCETPLHIAVQHFMKVPPLAIRMLFSSNADPNIADSQNTIPLDRFRLASAAPLSNPTLPDAPSRFRQVLDEFMERPTVSVGVLDGARDILSAHLANKQLDRIIFTTDASIGLYSLESKRIVYMTTLKQATRSTFKCLSVNPELGTVVVCLDVADTGPDGAPRMLNRFVIWPSGNFPAEEPLQLNISVDPSPGGLNLPSCAILSKLSGPQMLLGRLMDGRVISWRLSQARTKLKAESELASNAGIVAASDDGYWVAIVVSVDGVKGVKVFSYVSASGLRLEPTTVYWCEDKNPTCMAIQQASGDMATAHLALAEPPAAEGQPLPAVEVRTISVDGDSWTLYRLKIPSPCNFLSYCHNVVTHLLSGHTDGLIVLCDLPKAVSQQCHGSPDTQLLSMSADRQLVCAIESQCFRIFRIASSSDPGLPPGPPQS